MGKVREGFPNRRSHFVSIVVDVVPLYGCNQVSYFLLFLKKRKKFQFFPREIFCYKRETSSRTSSSNLKKLVSHFSKN
jgi:hypothetical protein